MVGLLQFPQSAGRVQDFVMFFLYSSIVASTLTCLVLLCRTRTTVVVLIVAKAIADCFSAVSFITYPATRAFLEDKLRPEAFAVEHICESVPGTFHLASVWLTLTLAMQRYMSVCLPTQARVSCTMAKTVRGVFITFFLASLLYLYRFVTLSLLEDAFNFVDTRELLPSVPTLMPNTTDTWCEFLWPDSGASDIPWVFYVYNITCFAIRSLFITHLPCFALILLTIMLIRALRQTEKRRAELTQFQLHNEARIMKEASFTTLMVLTIVALTLLTEVLSSVLSAAVALQVTYGLRFLSLETVHAAWMFVTFSNTAYCSINPLLCLMLNGKPLDASKDVYRRSAKWKDLQEKNPPIKEAYCRSAKYKDLHGKSEATSEAGFRSSKYQRLLEEDDPAEKY
nr:hypothetical protein BaRGS_015257 [Batillaria attramentaria]